MATKHACDTRRPWQTGLQDRGVHRAWAKRLRSEQSCELTVSWALPGNCRPSPVKVTPWSRDSRAPTTSPATPWPSGSPVGPRGHPLLPSAQKRHPWPLSLGTFLSLPHPTFGFPHSADGPRTSELPPGSFLSPSEGTAPAPAPVQHCMLVRLDVQQTDPSRPCLHWTKLHLHPT